jgi:hypothetical protein
MSTRPNVKDRGCSTCKARSGEPCVSRTGSGTVLDKCHSTRIDRWIKRMLDWQFEQQEAGRV